MAQSELIDHPKILVVIDENTTKDKATSQVLSLVLASLRDHATIELFPPTTSQESLIEKLENEPYHLLLAPIEKYFEWNKVESLFGLARTSGPVFAGYTLTPMTEEQIQQAKDRFRVVLVDFTSLSPIDAAELLQVFCSEGAHIGVQPLLETTAPIYVEMWLGDPRLGHLIDSVSALPEIAKSNWIKRINSIRVCLTALHTIVYNEGRGKGDLAKALGAKNVQGYFQIGIDAKCLAMRLYCRSPHASPKEVLQSFLPDSSKPATATQLLLRYGDVVRVHPIAETPDLEITVALWAAGYAEKRGSGIHTLWFDPATQNSLLLEPPFAAPSAAQPQLRMLSSWNTGAPKDGLIPDPNISAATVQEKSTERLKERQLIEAKTKIKDLIDTLAEKEELIRDLKSGGVGTAAPLPPPDTDSLLDAFREHYQLTRERLDVLKTQIQEAETNQASPQDIELLRQQIAKLSDLERGWIKKIAATLDTVRVQKEAQKKKTG